MKKPEKQKLWMGVSCLICVLVVLQNIDGLEGTEFSGGWLTGPLLTMAEVGSLLFLLAMVATFVLPRVAAATAIVSSLLCVPLYLFFVAPVPFSRVFAPGHEFKVYHSPGFHWDTWAIAGLLTVAFTTYFCLRALAALRDCWFSVFSITASPG